MTENIMQKMLKTSHLSGSSADYIDQLYEAYLFNPNSVSAEWQEYFSSLPQVNGQREEISHAAIRDHFKEQAKQPYSIVVKKSMPSQEGTSMKTARQQAHVTQLINAYRSHGHHHAQLDPLGLAKRIHLPDLELDHYDFTADDLNTLFSTESALTNDGAPLKNIYTILNETYCGTLGVEYMHITDPEQLTWLQNKIESVHGHPRFAPEQKRQILKELSEAEGLEKYLGTKYVGQKRFSLEGGESLIPGLEEIVNLAGECGVKEIVFGMAHRGRLNVLINVLGKSPAEIFEEFEGRKSPSELSGDVKYHLGFSSEVRTSSGNIVHLALAFNPSHLEIISPVVEGSVRARLRRRNDLEQKNSVLPIIIHGDAAFAGQGVVMETFNFSQARGYCTGGTVHIVINNQIGFTTSNPLDARSTLYCTDVAKMVQAPIFHVNGDDPEAVVFVSRLAFEYRMKFKQDIVIDLVCYRRQGHNEADEPSITQPMMYQAIRKLPSVRELYAEKCLKEGIVDQEAIDGYVYNYRDTLDKGNTVVETVNDNTDEFRVDWSPFINQHWRAKAETGIAKKILVSLGQRLTALPKNFTPHPVVKRLLADWEKMTKGELPLQWGFAENLAYASLVTEGYPVRVSGQDVGRGTFAHRQAVLHDYNTGEAYVPLQHLSANQQQFIIIDSVLSEEAVLGFEYGYAASDPNVLLIWEAQFGDFANGAQVVIDQFISSGEQKWGRLCGLAMFLPHGFEGAGPEHSSARLERFMQLCAQHNIQVCVPTTPAQIFHLIRRQVIRPYRKPLIVMTPKSLLRHKLAVSTLDELANGQYQVLIPEVDDLKDSDIQKVILCSGKVYYELLEERHKRELKNIAIIRLEQLYPFPKEELQAEFNRYAKAKNVVWCQEEPQNQGAWHSIKHYIEECLTSKQQLSYAGRGFFAAPAVGYLSLHLQQQQALIEQALSE